MRLLVAYEHCADEPKERELPIKIYLTPNKRNIDDVWHYHRVFGADAGPASNTQSTSAVRADRNLTTRGCGQKLGLVKQRSPGFGDARQG